MNFKIKITFLWLIIYSIFAVYFFLHGKPHQPLEQRRDVNRHDNAS